VTASVGTPGGQAYLYGLVPAGVPVPSGLTGVSGAAVEAVPLDSLQLVVSRIEPERFGLASDLVAHSSVLDGLAQAGDVVPMAVGTFIPMPPDATAEQRLTSAFARVRPTVAGAVQYALSVRYIEDVALAELVREDREIARLRERTSRNDGLRADRMRLGELVVGGLERKADADAVRILNALPTARQLRRRQREQPDAVVDVAALVDRDAAPAFEQGVENLAAQHAARMRFRLLGPQAPYDFVSGG
jgi:hypothetical protein